MIIWRNWIFWPLKWSGLANHLPSDP